MTGTGTRSAYGLKPLSSGCRSAITTGLSGRDHLLEEHRPLDRRREHVAASVRHEPPIPLEEVERFLYDGARESRGAHQTTRAQPVAEHRRRTEDVLRGLGEVTEPLADHADHRRRQVARQGVDEGSLGRWPGRRVGRGGRSESSDHRLEHRNGKQRNPRRIPLQTAHKSLRFIRSVSGERPMDEFAQRVSVQPPEPDHGAFQIAA